jgi:hypothetical protein
VLNRNTFFVYGSEENTGEIESKFFD